MPRKKGSKNKKTLEREEIKRLEFEKAAALDKARVAEDLLAAAKATNGKRLAKEVLRELMELFLGLAAMVQPWPLNPALPADHPGQKKNPRENPSEFREWIDRAAAVAKDLAPFESPRYSAVMVGATVVTKIEVTGGMPDDFARLPAPAEALAPGTVITADYEVVPEAVPKPADAA